MWTLIESSPSYAVSFYFKQDGSHISFVLRMARTVHFLERWNFVRPMVPTINVEAREAYKEIHQISLNNLWRSCARYGFSQSSFDQAQSLVVCATEEWIGESL
jgi:hypothetical protein